MSRVDVDLDRSGVGVVAKSAQMMDAVEDAANRIAANVGAQGLIATSGATKSAALITAVVSTGVTDRDRATVTIQHPAGLAMQARHGVLTKAASMAGLEVKAAKS